MIRDGEEMRRTQAEMDRIYSLLTFLLVRHCACFDSKPSATRMQSYLNEEQRHYPDLNLNLERKTINVFIKKHGQTIITREKITEQWRKQKERSYKRRKRIRQVDTKDRPYDKSEEERQKEKRKDEIAIAKILTKTNPTINYLLNNYYLNKGVNPRTNKIEVTNDYKGRKAISYDKRKADPRRTRVNDKGETVIYIPDALKGIRLSERYIQPSFELPWNAIRSLWVFDNRNNHKNKTRNHRYIWYTESVEEFIKGGKPKINEETKKEIARLEHESKKILYRMWWNSIKKT